MKIRFRKVTNIRSDHRSLKTAPLGVVYANTLLEVDGVIHEGASVNGDNRWWRDHNGWYYWAGETEAVLSESGSSSPAPVIEPAHVSPAPILPPVAPVPPPVLPPVPATELVALPIPDDNFEPTGDVPEGEWRSVDSRVPPTQTVVTESDVNSEFESFKPPLTPAPVCVNLK